MKERCPYNRQGDCTKRPYGGNTNCPEEYDPTIEGACRHKDIVFKEWCTRTLKAIPTADLIAELERRRPNCDKCANNNALRTDHLKEDGCDFNCVWQGFLKEDNFKEAK